MAQPRRVVVVGGGCAGWMAAAFLGKVLGVEAASSYCSVTLVDTGDAASIEAGEATLHTLRNFLGALGVVEGEFMAATDATFRHGTLFRDWLHAPGGSPGPAEYFHPFEGYVPIAPELMVNHWLNARHQGACSDPYHKWAGVHSTLALAGLSPKNWNSGPYEGVVPYGYHFDGAKLAAFLRSLAVRRGVMHRQGELEEISLDAEGWIRALRVRGQDPIEGDLFIDCSGFPSRLMDRLGAKFIPFSDRLLVDAAVIAASPGPDGSSPVPRPYTTVTARKAGWSVEIDLSNRACFGYHYSSRHLDAEGAERQLRGFLGPGRAEVAVNHVKMQIGRLERSWIGNCIAIGSSAGVLEPLESPDLYFIEVALRLLADYLDLDCVAVLREQYNATAAGLFDEVARFVALHYLLSQRTDTEFWRDAIRDTASTHELDAQLQLWLHKPPTDSDFFRLATPFGPPSYAAVLFGMERLTSRIPQLVRHVSAEDSMAQFRKLESAQSHLCASLPRHDVYLKKYAAAFSS